MAAKETPVPASLEGHRPLTTADLPAVAEYVKAANKPASSGSSGSSRGRSRSKSSGTRKGGK